MEAIANTVGEALAQARERVPPDSEIVREITRIPPNESTTEVEATDEQTAIAAMKRQSSSTATFSEIELVSKAKKGFLGIGRKSNVYRARVSQPAVVGIIFRKKAKLELEVGELPPTGFCQFCGKSDARQYVGAETNPGHYEPETIRYFCGRSSLMSFCKAKMETFEIEYSLHRDLMGFGSAMALQGAMKGDGRASSMLEGLSTLQGQSKTSNVYCWSCGKSLLPLSDVCVHCQKKQKIRRL